MKVMRQRQVGDVEFPYYQVHDVTTDPHPVYHCGRWPDCEAAIISFNGQHGHTVGKTFTTMPTGGASDTDYILIEKEPWGEVGWRDGKSIPLYRL
jgi:hypothetical protein